MIYVFTFTFLFLFFFSVVYDPGKQKTAIVAYVSVYFSSVRGGSILHLPKCSVELVLQKGNYLASRFILANMLGCARLTARRIPVLAMGIGSRASTRLMQSRPHVSCSGCYEWGQ